MVLIEIVGQKNKNARLQDLAAKNSRIRDAKKDKKTRFRDSFKTPPRFRDWNKNFRDPEFSRYHSPPLYTYNSFHLGQNLYTVLLHRHYLSFQINFSSQKVLQTAKTLVVHASIKFEAEGDLKHKSNIQLVLPLSSIGI